MKPVISIGTQDFAYLRNHHCFYIDKTSFIKEWWENNDAVTLITRPRRFGKTLNLNMTETFFSNQCTDKKQIFEGLSIWNEEKYRLLQGSYPVIFLSFAEIKSSNYETARDSMIQVISWYDGFRFGSTSDIYNPWSITKYLDAQEFAPYWMNTSSNKLVGQLIQERSSEVKIAMDIRHYGFAFRGKNVLIG